MLSKAQLQMADTVEELLRAAERGMTGEALLIALAKKMGRALPERVVLPVLRQLPQRFVDDGAGRWSLRVPEPELVAVPAEDELAERSQEEASPTLRRGCYVVFDLEATGQKVGSPATEIIQIAAQRWIDGQAQASWMKFARPTQAVPERIIALTQIKPAELEGAAGIVEVLQKFFEFVGDLPLIAHNGASYDGPLLAATCERNGISLPPTFRVLDTLPLARTLLPCLEAHRVGTLAKHFGCSNPDAHRADADVEMLAGIVKGLERQLQEDASTAAVYELLRRANDPWCQLLAPPTRNYESDEVCATFGVQMTPLLPERGFGTTRDDGENAGRLNATPPPAPVLTLGTPTGETKEDGRGWPDGAEEKDGVGSVRPDEQMEALEAAFERAEALGRDRREAQIEMARLAASAIRDGNFAVVEAGTGTGKSSGYLLPAALAARATGLPVAVSTFTRVLQNQLVTRELPFIRQLVPTLTYSQLQGRANYLSLTRLSEEIEEALNEERLNPARAWMLGTLARFAATSAHGNLDELGVIPLALDTYLGGDGVAFQVLASTRSSSDDRPGVDVPLEFYQRARENAERADIVVINHALLFRNLAAQPEETREEVTFAGTLICDEAHTLEDAATTALERRVEERVLRRILRAIALPRAQGGLVNACRGPFLPTNDASLAALSESVDTAQAALDGLTRRLHTYVERQVVISRAERERYGARVRIERAALSAIGGPDLKDTADALGRALGNTRDALRTLIQTLENAGGQEDKNPRRRRRLVRLARSLQRDLRTLIDNYYWFWQFRESGNYVHVVELERLAEGTSARGERRAPIAISAVPINIGPLLWERLWSQLRAAICTSATLTVYGQGFDFFLRRVGLEHERIAAEAPGKQLITHELPPAFDYHANALLMLPNNLPAPRDSALKQQFPTAVADLLGRFIPFFGGKTLGLFTANARLDFVYETLVDQLVEQGFPLLRQGQGSTQRLVDDFRANIRASLLGSRSLWEGIDVPEETLSYVFLEKLPYPSLGDPVEAARMSAVENAGGNAFYDYLLPKMIIILKQGFGRLIRSPRDRGAVILLDKRLRNSLYRAEVLRSLPNPTIGEESDVELFQHVAAWMGLHIDPSELPQPTVPDVQLVLQEQALAETYVDVQAFAQEALPRLLAVQRAIWNQDSFREGQEAIMRDVLAGKDVLTLLPTGAGKSRTYQLPALIRPGLTLIISPLIALIRDQVEKLREVPGLTCVAALISGVDAASQEEILRDAAAGRIKLLYISPERLRDPRFRAYLDRLPIVQLVVDEAHCIATWGHDFRPDYREISRLLRVDRRNLPVHALTATAPRQVRDEIIATLNMGQAGHDLAEHPGDFRRPNLVFRTYTITSDSDQNALTLGIVHQLVSNREQGGAGIVYASTRRKVTQIANILRNANITAQAYHAGLTTPERHQIQERFMQGDLDVVVATNAFGMGVDKAEIRFVLHYDHPASLEAYIQEAGRAGRDGKPAYAILLYHRNSQRTLRYIGRQNVPAHTALINFHEALHKIGTMEEAGTRLPDGNVLCAADTPGRLAEIKSPTQARILLYAFEEAGLLQRGVDCTLEATLLLNRPVDTIVSALEDASEQDLARRLLIALDAEPDRQITYQAAKVYQETGIDPRQVDPLLVRLAERDLLLYRAYSRGITYQLANTGSLRATLSSIERNYEQRYQIFEQRLDDMLTYCQLQRGQNLCRSAELINYLTGQNNSELCGKCDLCSPGGENLPWDASARLYGEEHVVDLCLTILSAVRDHNRFFSRNTFEMMLLGIPMKRYADGVKPISKSARASDHYEILKDYKNRPDVVRRTFEALIEGGYLELIERPLSDGQQTYQALAISTKGRDALAGGVALPDPSSAEVV